MPVFEFVNPDDPTARSKAKSHVARKAHREKRLREIESYRSRVDPAPKPARNPSDTSSSTADVPIRRQPVDDLTRPRDAEPQTASPSSESGPSSDGDTAATESLDEPSADRATWVDTYAARVTARPQDSFWTAYSRLDAGDRNLLEWYLVKVPELTFGIEHTAPLNPMRDWVFPLVGDSAAVLHSSLLIGAVNNPSFSTGEKGSSRILMQKGRTISLINHGLQKGQAAISDDIMYAVAATAISEDRLCNYDACRTHLDGLKQMIRLRGGIHALRTNSALCAALTWAEVSVSNHAAALPRTLHSQETSRRTDPSRLSIVEDRYEEQLFCRFLNRLQKVQLSKRRNYVAVDHHALGETEFLFRKGSPLLAMLGETDAGVITPNSRMNAYNCQVACLFYINFMLCEVHDNPPLTAAFLVRLSWLVRQHSRTRVPRASLFVWIFLREIEKHDGGEGEMDRLDWLIRMVRVARRLSQESVHMLHQALLRSLKTHEPAAAGMQVSNDLSILTSRIEIGTF